MLFIQIWPDLACSRISCWKIKNLDILESPRILSHTVVLNKFWDFSSVSYIRFYAEIMVHQFEQIGHV